MEPVLDFGCGEGRLVDLLREHGLDAFGADFDLVPDGIVHRSTITTSPYRLPFDDASFDAVVSTSVLEHAQNTEECFREIHRVLKPGGLALHLFPGKWYLPTEPHLYVPFVSWLWPRVPRGWLALWARAGVRNEDQADLDPATVVERNAEYIRSRLCYLTTRRHTTLSRRVFGNAEWPMRYYIDNAPGGVCRLARRLPFRGLSGLVSCADPDGLPGPAPRCVRIAASIPGGRVRGRTDSARRAYRRS